MSQKSGPGWVRGTGRRDCPVGYPVKGNEPSNVYYEPGDPGYPQVIPEMCFEDATTAVKVGFTHVGGGSAAAAASAGFLRQTGGGRECPAGYPIKGNEPSNVFYRPEDPGYAQVIPEVCFADVSEAEKAGFTRVKVDAVKRTEPVAAVRKEEVAAAGAAVAGAAAVKASETAKAAEPAKVAEKVKVAEPAKVAAPPPPPPPPPPPAPVAEASGGGWMKWLLPLLALAALAAGIWYFTRDDNKDKATPTAAATVAATTAAGTEGTVESAAPTTAAASGSPETLATEGASVTGSVEAGVSSASGSVEAGVGAVTGSVEAGVASASTGVANIEGTVEGAAGAVEGSVEAGTNAVATGAANVEGTVEAASTSVAGTVESASTSVAGTVEAAVATGSPVASPAAAGTIELDAKDIAFVPTEITIKASDEPVTIKMKNTGAALHNFSIDSLKIDVDVNPGETVDVVIPAGTAPGTYDFYCNVPGHKEAGMVGKLIVK